jgi:hypothetical protein
MPRPRELNWASLALILSTFPKFRFAARPQQAFKKAKGIQNAAKQFKRPGELAPAAVQLGTLHDDAVETRISDRVSRQPTNYGRAIASVVSHIWNEPMQSWLP